MKKITGALIVLLAIALSFIDGRLTGKYSKSNQQNTIIPQAVQENPVLAALLTK
jgi:hypothetical protein